MTSSATLIERLRRAATTAEPERDVAVVLSEFIDDGGLEAVDNPFHPDQREPNTGLVATIASNRFITVTLVRSADGVFGPPQRHGVAIAVAVLTGGVVVEIFTEVEEDSTDPNGQPSTTSEPNPHHVVDGLSLSPQVEVETGSALDEVTDSEHSSLPESPPEPRMSELLPAGSSEMLSEEVTVVQGDVVHRTRFVDGVNGLALHVAIGDLTSAIRERWIDDTVYSISGSSEYPLSGTV